MKIGVNSGDTSVPSFSLELYNDENMVLQTIFGYDNEDERCYLGLKSSGIFKLNHEDAEFSARIYIDRSVIEIFINDRWAISQTVKIGAKTPLSLRFTAEEREIHINSIEFWGMKSIY